MKKAAAFFEELKKHNNIEVLELDGSIKEKFESKYELYKDKLFFDVIDNCGGIIIDNWIRLYGCGKLNVIEKNNMIKNEYGFEAMIGEDITGGIFALKDNVVYYYAPDTLRWECLEIYYAYFLDWLINHPDKVDIFYKSYRWDNWKNDVKNIEIGQGVSFYPLPIAKCDINSRSRKFIDINEIIRLNFDMQM